MYGMDPHAHMRTNGQPPYPVMMMPNNYGPMMSGYARMGPPPPQMAMNRQGPPNAFGSQRRIQPRTGNRGPTPQAQQPLARGGSFVGGQPGGSFLMQPGFGSMTNLQGSFRKPGSMMFNSSLYNMHRTNSGYTSLGARSLPRVNSGVNFDYYNNSSQSSIGGGGGANNPYGSMTQMPSFYRYNSFSGNNNPNAGGGRPGRSATTAGAPGGNTGLSGIGPGLSMPSLGSIVANQTAQETPGKGGDDPLTRQDSAVSLQRQYSVAGHLYHYNNSTSNNGSNNGGAGAAAGRQPGWMPNPNQPRFGQYSNGQQQQQHPPPGMMAFRGPYGGVAPQNHVLTLHGGGPFVHPRGGMPQSQQPPNGPAGGMQPQQQRLAGNNSGGAPNEEVEEGQPHALGRKNSSQSLSRKNSEKRVGMYFNNKEATDGEYKKEGDPGTGKKGSAKDPTLTNTVKAILMLDHTSGNADLEVDGRTVRAMKPGADEVQKYDMRDVIYVHRTNDVDVNSESIEEIRDNFVYGCNVGMIMADADCPASDPASWFSWLALKSVVRGTFAKLDGKGEVTVSMCLLQDDQVLDLLADSPRGFMSLAVAESPLFGNVANNLMYMSMDDAGEFNDTLDAALARASGRGSGGEYGIVLVTCVLKQVRRSSSSGKEDVIVSSIFASGVGDGVIHYNRILDKNPAEPRALFYSVLHRSVHSCAIFSCADTNPEVLTYLATLQRFSKVETRKPKVGSVRTFVSFSKSTVPKIKDDAAKMQEGRQKAMTLRYLEKLELMLADAEDMLRNPTESLPKTYM